MHSCTGKMCTLKKDYKKPGPQEPGWLGGGGGAAAFPDFSEVEALLIDDDKAKKNIATKNKNQFKFLKN